MIRRHPLILYERLKPPLNCFSFPLSIFCFVVIQGPTKPRVLKVKEPKHKMLIYLMDIVFEPFKATLSLATNKLD